MTLDNIKEEIEKAESILVLAHENPDGDAIGSCLAMYIALNSKNKNVEVAVKDFPKAFSFVPFSEVIVEEPSRDVYDLVIILDCADKKRPCEVYLKYIDNAKVRISIDHHSKNTMFADFNFVNPASPACCQILINVLKYLDVEITKEIATCLLTGIITDTGGFKNSGITGETFEFASECLDMGINVSKIYRQALLITTIPKFELKKIAMDRMEFLENGRIAFTYLTTSGFLSLPSFE